MENDERLAAIDLYLKKVDQRLFEAEESIKKMEEIVKHLRTIATPAYMELQYNELRDYVYKLNNMTSLIMG